ISTGYLLAQTVFQLVFCHVSHAIGRKHAYLSGLGLYMTGSLAASMSTCTRQLVAFRVIQGTGAAGMLTMSAIIVVDILPLRRRAAWSARSIFWMELIFSGILFISLAFLLPSWQGRKTKPLTVLKNCDWIGMILFLIYSIATLTPINIGGSVKGWSSAPVISCFVVSVVSLVALIVHQRHIAKNPAFPREVFSRHVTKFAFVGSVSAGILLSMVFYNLVLFWSGVRHLRTIDVGVMLLSLTLTYTVSAAATGMAIRTWGHIRWATVAGTLFAVLGLGLMYFMSQSTPVYALILISMTAAAGCGIHLPAMINTILASTDKSWHSHAIATRTLLHTAGQCMGVSLGLAIFSHDPHGSLSQSAIITPQSLMRVIKDLPRDSAVIDVIVYALRWVWGTACVLALVAGTLTCLFKCPPLPKDKKEDTDTESK
ncbi:major facilitator superfamily domain-containing protein, partial [Coniella lustricola]